MEQSSSAPPIPPTPFQMFRLGKQAPIRLRWLMPLAQFQVTTPSSPFLSTQETSLPGGTTPSVSPPFLQLVLGSQARRSSILLATPDRWNLPVGQSAAPPKW